MTVSNLAKRSDNLYKTTIQFSSLNTTDGGNYECEATVTSDPQSQFVIMSTAGSDTHSVTVHGEHFYTSTPSFISKVCLLSIQLSLSLSCLISMDDYS